MISNKELYRQRLQNIDIVAIPTLIHTQAHVSQAILYTRRDRVLAGQGIANEMMKRSGSQGKSVNVVKVNWQRVRRTLRQKNFNDVPETENARGQ